MNLLNALMPAHQELLDVIAEHIASERLAEDYAGEQIARGNPIEPVADIARQVHWKIVAVEMPDDEITVLVYTPADSEPIWIGFHDDGKWRTPSGIPMSFAVTHWAHFPEPPPLS